MRILGMRFCSVSPEAQALTDVLTRLGLSRRVETGSEAASPDGFKGAVFPIGDSWIEVWPDGPKTPAGVMLQLEVDDADAWAERARQNGLEPQGPMEAHGERIYFLNAPSGLPLTFQSRIDTTTPVDSAA